MPDDDVPFLGIKCVISFCILERQFRMMQPVQPVAGMGDVPVIEKIIMEQRTPYQAFFIDAKVQFFRQQQAEICHCNRMIIA